MGRPASQTLEVLGLVRDDSGVHAGSQWCDSEETIASINPADGKELGRVRTTSTAGLARAIEAATESFLQWRHVPAPRRGELVRRIGEELRRHKTALGRLVSLESGKILSEGEGEVQEMIDMADLAVGLSRTIGGPTLPSERAEHRMFEQWHPLGPVGVITAFNFPVAVWAWNALVAAVCGDTVLWKPSEKTPLTAAAVHRIVERACNEAGFSGLFHLVVGDSQLGARLAEDSRLPLVSATGSCRMGDAVARSVAARHGKYLLELGGNNAVIVLDDADEELALRAVLFGSLGTAGQRCTTTRRVILQRGIARRFEGRLLEAYRSARLGDPLDADTLVGPLIDEDAVRAFEAAVARIEAQGGKVLCGGRRVRREGFFVEPTLVRAAESMLILREETFAPILYLLEVDDLEAAIRVQNDVPQGLSSAIFTTSLRAAERFLSGEGSDCGIANVNIGTSGAEIGGAFGGEKETGGGREAGSDSWKAYMRRQTCTVNYGTDLPLAQGVRFDV